MWKKIRDIARENPKAPKLFKKYATPLLKGGQKYRQKKIGSSCLEEEESLFFS